jgi:hypothetical protein
MAVFTNVKNSFLYIRICKNTLIRDLIVEKIFSPVFILVYRQLFIHVIT